MFCRLYRWELFFHTNPLINFTNICLFLCILFLPASKFRLPILFFFEFTNKKTLKDITLSKSFLGKQTEYFQTQPLYYENITPANIKTYYFLFEDLIPVFKTTDHLDPLVSSSIIVHFFTFETVNLFFPIFRLLHLPLPVPYKIFQT